MAIQEETCDTVIKLWSDFNELYKIISKEDPITEDFENYFEQATTWVKLFLSFSGKRKGYNRARVTPYMHIMVYHIPHFFSLYKTILKSLQDRVLKEAMMWLVALSCGSRISGIVRVMF